MKYQRIHIRVPLKADAALSDKSGVVIKTRAIDISAGGVAVKKPDTGLTQDEYSIHIVTASGKTIDLKAIMVRQNSASIGFKTVHIEEKDLKIITAMVYEYQETPDFIKQLDEHNIFEQHFVDEDGNELEITFDVDPPD